MALLVVLFVFFVISSIADHFFSQYINTLPMFIILFLWIIVNIADTHSTLFSLRNGCKEGNPVGRWFTEKFGIKKGLVIGKFATVIPITFLLAFLDKSAIVVLTIVMALVVIWNYCLGMYAKYSKRKNNQATASPNYPKG